MNNTTTNGTATSNVTSCNDYLGKTLVALGKQLGACFEYLRKRPWNLVPLLATIPMVSSCAGGGTAVTATPTPAPTASPTPSPQRPVITFKESQSTSFSPNRVAEFSSDMLILHKKEKPLEYTVTSDSPEALAILKAGSTMWEKQTNNNVSFVFMDPSVGKENVDVYVTFSDGGDKKVRPGEAATTYRTYSDPIRRADPTGVSRTTGTFSKAEIFIIPAVRDWSVASKIYLGAHELGHAIGMPHTTDQNDIMHPVAREGGIITEKTLNTAYWLSRSNEWIVSQ